MSEAILSDNSIVREDRQAKEWTPAKVVYTGLMAFNLLSFLWLLATGSGIDMPPVIWIARIAVAPLAIYLGKLWKDRGFQILSVYALFFFFRAFIPDPGSIFSAELAESILSALWLFAGCYGLGRILGKSTLKKILCFFSWIWTAFIAVLSVIGIYAVWTEKTINILDGAIIELFASAVSHASRLSICYSATVTGSILSLSAIIAIILFICSKNRVRKILCVICLFPMVLALALTDSRTAYVSWASGMGILCFMAVFRHYKISHNTKEVYGFQWKPWAFGIIALIIVTIGLTYLIIQITPVFNHIKTRGIIPNAYAEGTYQATVSSRGFDGTGFLSGRDEIWGNAFQRITQSVKVFFIGTSKINPLQGVIDGYAHCHNLYLQVFLESGSLGISMIALFVLYSLVVSFRAINNTHAPCWICCLPAVVVSLLVGDIAECFLWLRSSQCIMGTVFFVSVGIISACFSKQAIKKNNES